MLKIIVGFVIFVLGIGLAGAQSVGLGIAVGIFGLWIMSKMTVADEQNFMGCLMVLGAIGAIIPFVQFAWQQISKLLP